VTNTTRTLRNDWLVGRLSRYRDLPVAIRHNRNRKPRYGSGYTTPEFGGSIERRLAILTTRISVNASC